jgi:hypothetical protein
MPLALNDYPRYGRQMILDGFGLPGRYEIARLNSPLILPKDSLNYKIRPWLLLALVA